MKKRLILFSLLIAFIGLLYGQVIKPVIQPEIIPKILPEINPHIFLQTDQTPQDDLDFMMTMTGGGTCTIDWGDGESSAVSGGATTYDHHYGATGDYNIRIYGDLDKITDFEETSNPISGDIKTFAQATGLIYLNLNSTSVDGDIANLSGLTSLNDLRLNNPSVDGDIANLSGLTSLIYLYLNNTSVDGDIANLSSLIILIKLYLNNTSVDTYTQGVLPDWDACEIYIQDLGLSQQEVDDFLCDLDTASTASTKTLNIAGTNAAPSATGIACKNSLVTKGWTVTVSE